MTNSDFDPIDWLQRHDPLALPLADVTAQDRRPSSEVPRCKLVLVAVLMVIAGLAAMALIGSRQLRLHAPTAGPVSIPTSPVHGS